MTEIISTSTCTCGHSAADHQPLHPQCSALHCDCLRFRPATPVRAAEKPALRPVPTPPPAKVSEPTIEQLIAAGKRSEHKRTQALAARIAGQVADLRERVRTEREEAEAAQAERERVEKAQARVAELEEQLAKALAELGQTPAGKPAKKGSGVCPDCGKDGLINVGVHRARKHGLRAAS